MKKIHLHAEQHLYCDFDESGIGDTCLLCGGDVRFVSYAPCPKGIERELTVQSGEHLIVSGKDDCLICQGKLTRCSLREDSLYLQY